ncbi:MAG: SGNH/GDSL hydrolase family protein [Anaerolineae bacterium]
MMRINRFGFVCVSLSVVFLLIVRGAGSAAAQESVDLTPPVLGEFDPASVADLQPDDFPVIPPLTEFARQIFEQGAASGRDPHLFSKVGDSMTNSSSFLVPFGTGDYVLGEYADLEAAIAYFREPGDENAFNRTNYANALGFTTASALDSTWADPDACEPNESPLDCEYRIANPAFALIMFGTNDVMFFEPDQFNYFLRTILLETIDANVVPILYTYPIRPEEPEKSVVFNQIILQIAQDYDLPLINLVRELEPLPAYGVDPNDTLHLTIPEPPGSVATFEGDSLTAGYTLRNLVTLQTLDGLLRELELID